MEPKPPSFVPPRVAQVLAVIAVAAAAAAALVPPEAKPYVELGAFVLAFFAGIALPQLQVVAGKPAITGAAVTHLAGGAVVLEQLSQSLPPQFQPLAYAGAALLAMLAGKSLPSFAPVQAAGVEASKAPGPNLGA
jgi:uncharacterized membrane protein YeiH